MLLLFVIMPGPLAVCPVVTTPILVTPLVSYCYNPIIATGSVVRNGAAVARQYAVYE
jgi:hypothetical protein